MWPMRRKKAENNKNELCGYCLQRLYGTDEERLQHVDTCHLNPANIESKFQRSRRSARAMKCTNCGKDAEYSGTVDEDIYHCDSCKSGMSFASISHLCANNGEVAKDFIDKAQAVWDARHTFDAGEADLYIAALGKALDNLKKAGD